MITRKSLRAMRAMNDWYPSIASMAADKRLRDDDAEIRRMLGFWVSGLEPEIFYRSWDYTLLGLGITTWEGIGYVIVSASIPKEERSERRLK